MIQVSACKIFQVSYKVFEALSKTFPKIVHYKARGRPTLPSSTRLARPPAPTTPAIPESATDAAADVGVDFEVVGFESPNIETSRAIRNYPDLVLGTSERFRTVPNGSKAPPNGSERFRGPLCRFTSGLRVVCVQVPVCSVPWEFSVEGRGFAVQSSDGESRIDATRSQLPTF